MAAVRTEFAMRKLQGADERKKRAASAGGQALSCGVHKKESHRFAP
jgi:hypothetical protein